MKYNVFIPWSGPQLDGSFRGPVPLCTSRGTWSLAIPRCAGERCPRSRAPACGTCCRAGPPSRLHPPPHGPVARPPKNSPAVTLGN